MQEPCIEAVEKCVWLLKYVPDHFKAEEMCDKAVHNIPCMLLFVPDCLKTQEMCEEAVGGMPMDIEACTRSLEDRRNV